MNIKTCDSCHRILFCIVIFLVGGATTTQAQQQDTNDVTLLIAEVNQLKDKVKTQEDVILRANSRISELESQLTEQTKQNSRLQLLCEKAGIKITVEPDENSSPNQLKNQRMEPNLIADETKDAEKMERVRIKIQKMYDAIELDNTRINNLSSRGHTFTTHEPLAKSLENATEKCRLYHHLEGNYKDIIQLAKIYPELGIDVMAMEKTLIVCQSRKQDAESNKKELQERSDSISDTQKHRHTN